MEKGIKNFNFIKNFNNNNNIKQYNKYNIAAVIEKKVLSSLIFKLHLNLPTFVPNTMLQENNKFIPNCSQQKICSPSVVSCIPAPSREIIFKARLVFDTK